MILHIAASSYLVCVSVFSTFYAHWQHTIVIMCIIHGAPKSRRRRAQLRLLQPAPLSDHVAARTNCDVVYHRRRRVLSVVCTSNTRPDAGSKAVTNRVFLRVSCEVRQCSSCSCVHGTATMHYCTNWYATLRYTNVAFWRATAVSSFRRSHISNRSITQA